MNKKRIIIILLGLIVLGVIVFLIIKNCNKDIPSIVNKNSDLPVKYMIKKTSFKDDDKYEVINNYMSVDYHDNDVKFSFYGYPNDESDFYLGSLEIVSNKYNLLGVKVGDNLDKAISKIESYGFKRIEKENNNYMVTLTKGDYTIRINKEITVYSEDKEEEEVGAIKISVKSEYLGNNVY